MRMNEAFRSSQKLILPETRQAGKANLYQLRPRRGLPITTVVRASPEWSGDAAGVHFWVLLAYPENPSVIRLDFCLPQDSEHRELPKRPEVWMETEETINRNESHRNRSQVRTQLTCTFRTRLSRMLTYVPSAHTAVLLRMPNVTA